MRVFGAFVKLRKVTINFMTVCLSVRPSIHMEKLGSHWTDFYEILYWHIFRNFVGKISTQLKSDKNNGHFT